MSTPDRGRLVFVGQVIVDVVMRVDRVPEPGGDTVAHSSLQTAGGGYNTMIAAARDGADVVFTGQYGTGPFGDIVREALRAGGFEVVQPGVAGADSGYCVALVDATTERTFITSIGAEGMLTADDMARVDVDDADVVYVSGYALAVRERARVISEWLAGVPEAARVIFDPGPLVGDLDEDLRTRVLARTDILTVNAREARILGDAGPTGGHAQLLAMIRGGGAVILRDGKEGAVLIRNDASARSVPSIAVDAVDSNGAGDAHGGVLAAALLRGEELEAAVRRANIAAALAVTEQGPATSPSRAQIDAVLADEGSRPS